MLRWFTLILFGIAATASADPAGPESHRFTFVGPRAEASAPASQISPYIYFNRCAGNCIVHGGTTDDARVNASTIPCPTPQCSGGACTCTGGSSGTWTVHEFQNQYGQTASMGGTCLGDGVTHCTANATCSGTCTGAGSTCAGGAKAGQACTGNQDCQDTCDTADYEWAQLMQCLKDVYSPFGVTVSDMPPANGLSYTEDFIAGAPADIGYGAGGVGGIAPGGCDAKDNVVSFSFSNVTFWGTGQHRIWELCATAAQETAHAFGLEHEYSFITAYPGNSNSACMDPMTYRTDCGGEKFFRNAASNCGEFATRPCVCGGAQNSHQKILAVFGAGTSDIPAPTVGITFPAAGAGVSGAFVVAASAGSRRAVDKMELWLNGYKWSEVPGAPFLADGQPNPSAYSLQAPQAVPNSIIDIVVKAYDDLGTETDSATVTVTKGSPCVTADTCATGQKCDTGRCLWDPPTGNIGDACSYPQFCVSAMCSPSGMKQICTQDCTPGVSDSCPTGFECVATSNADGYCYTKASDGGGCCETGSTPLGGIAATGLSVLALGLVLRRRR
jgi:hypothetical protein